MADKWSPHFCQFCCQSNPAKELFLNFKTVETFHLIFLQMVLCLVTLDSILLIFVVCIFCFSKYFVFCTQQPNPCSPLRIKICFFFFFCYTSQWLLSWMIGDLCLWVNCFRLVCENASDLDWSCLHLKKRTCISFCQ